MHGGDPTKKTENAAVGELIVTRTVLLGFVAFSLLAVVVGATLAFSYESLYTNMTLFFASLSAYGYVRYTKEARKGALLTVLLFMGVLVFFLAQREHHSYSFSWVLVFLTASHLLLGGLTSLAVNLPLVIYVLFFILYRYNRWGESPFGVASIVNIMLSSFAVMVLLGFFEFSRKRFYLEVKDTQAKKASILEASNVGAWEWNIQQNQYEVDDRWVAILGYSVEELAPLSHETKRRLVHPKDWEQVEEELQHVMKGNKEFYLAEFRIRHKKGHWVWVQERGRITSYAREKSPEVLIGTSTDITGRKEAEEEKRKSQEMLQLVMNSIPQYIFWKDKEGRYLGCNENGARLVGLRNKEDIVGLRDTDLSWKKEEAALLLDFDKEVIRTKETARTLLECQIHRSRSTWFDTVKIPLTDSQGNLSGILVTLEDVTERKKMEEALKRSEARFRSVIAVSNTGAWEYYRDRDYQWCSVEYFAMLGYSPQDFETTTTGNIQEVWVQLLHPDDRDKAIYAFSEYLTKREGTSYENFFRMRHKRGDWIWIWARGQTVVDSNGNLTELTIGTHIDVTPIKHIEQALHLEKEQFRATLQSVEDGVIATDKEGRVLLLNLIAERLTGFGQKEALGMPIEEVVCLLDQKTRRGRIHPAPLVLEKGLPMDFGLDTMVVSRYGQECLIEGNVAPIRNEEGEPDGVVLVLRDVTQKRKQEQELALLYEQLEEELERARTVHARLMQVRLPELKGISIDYWFSPATFIGGDFFHMVRFQDKLVLYLSDVTGHGLEGTIFGLFIKSTIDSYLELVRGSELSPEGMLRYLDHQVRKSEYPSEYAVAVFVLIMDVETLEVGFSAAGFHFSPVVVAPKEELLFLECKELPISPDIPWELANFSRNNVILKHNAYVVLATDGIAEQTRGNTRYEERLLDLLCRYEELPAETVVDRIQGDFQDFLGDRGQFDDVTLVVLSTVPTAKLKVTACLSSLDQVREEARIYYGDHAEKETLLHAIHELTANAIEHGNQLDPKKTVHITFSKRAVVVEDEGMGFNWREKLAMPLDLFLDSERGRGIGMILLMSCELVYNQKGNRVSLLFSL